MDDRVWKIGYSEDNPPRRLWTLVDPPPRAKQQYISLGPTYKYLFPLHRVQRLLAPETADNDKFYVPDAITFNGRLQEIKLVYNGGKNHKQQILDWITAGQRVDNINREVHLLESRFDANSFHYEGIDGDVNGFSELLMYFIDILPSDVDCPPTEKYWKLQSDTFGMLSVGGGLHPPVEGYISLATYRTLVPNSILGQAGDWRWTAADYWLPIRNEAGHVRWMKCSVSPDRKNPDTWREYFNLSTLACETQNETTRRTNPIMELTIHHTGFGKLTIDQLRLIFTDAATRCNQTFQIVALAPIGGYIFMGRSPFNDFDTYITTAAFDSYQQNRADYQISPDVVVTGLLPEVDRELERRVYVTAANITSARDQRKHLVASLKSQKTIMGVSATVIAMQYNWTNSNQKVGNAGHNPTWPATNNMPAEWLHRCAFSWGGLNGEPGQTSDFRTSQTNTNLIFGSSETNSLMTRFERSWQLLVQYEQLLRDGTFGNTDVFYGVLTTSVVEIQDQPWLAASMKYRLEFERSWLLGNNWNYLETTFYPFSRPLFTALEAEADRGVLATLWANHSNKVLDRPPEMGEDDKNDDVLIDGL